jgi:tetratricopeptide (TPR) repeat protein
MRAGAFGLLLVALTLAPPGAAQVPALSERSHERLAAAQQAMERGRHAEAADLLEALLAERRLEPGEAAVVQQNLGYARLALGHHERAVTAFEAALRSEVLPEAVAHPLRYNLAQLHARAGRWREALDALAPWLAAERTPSAEAHLLAGHVYHRLGRQAQAIEHLQQAIDGAAEPPEDRLQLLLAAYLADGREAAAAALLQRLVTRYPARRGYWLQLSDLHLRLKREHAALATLELAQQHGVLQPADLPALARLYLHLDMPYRAARLLEGVLESGSEGVGAEDWELLAAAWQRAQEPERAVDALRRVGALRADGTAALRAGRLLMDLERWEEAVAELEAALRRGGLARPAEAQLLLGIAALEAGDPARAIPALQRAAQHGPTRPAAEAWLARAGAAAGRN